MLQQAALPGPPQPLHTTSDLLRLLAADAHPFAAVAEAVAARFGGTAESQAWLAHTLVTLLRDGLLYTEAEKMNAAYLLRFAAPGAAGSREALLHLALPDGGEPPAVRAWAATLAQPLPGEAPASGSSLGSIGSAGSSPAASPSWQQQQARTAGLAAAALLHQRTPRQVLTETAGLQDTRTPFGQQPLATPSPQLPWQATANLSAAAATPPPAMFDALPGSPSLAPSVPPWLQPQQPMSPPAVHRVASPLAAPAQLPPAASFSPHSLSPMPSHALPTALGQSPPPLSLQPLPPPLQPLAPEPAATLTYAAHQLQQQQQQQVPPQLLQQREQAELSALQDLLQQAAQASLVPAKQQQLVDALGGSLAPRLTAPLAAAVSGSSGGMPAALQPHHMRGLVEQNCPVASQLLLALLEHHPEAAAVYSAAVAEVPMSAQSVECLSAVIAGGGALPGWVLATFLANCMQDVSGCADAGRQSRHVKLLCACVALVLQRQPHALAESLPELLSFCIEQSRHKPAADLYRQLRGLEAAAG